MKKISPLKSMVFIFVLTGMIAGGCASTRNIMPSFVGSWDYTAFDTPEGDLNGIFVIDKINDGYKGKIKMRGMGVDMQNLIIDGNKVSFYIIAQGYKVDFNGEFDGDTFSGLSALGNNEFKINAIKKK